MLKGNKGEWSEIYAFCYLLGSGILQAADKDLNPIESVFFPIIKILRDDMSYYPAEKPGDKIRIFRKDVLVKEFSKQDFDSIIELLKNQIPRGSKAFQIPESKTFMDALNIHSIKASSLKKKDIDIQIHDINTGIEPICGFSIKSFLGGNPTLVNAGKNTNFLYRIAGCNKKIMDEFNKIDTRNKLIDRMNCLLENNCELEFTGAMWSKNFMENMKFIDTLMPQILSECLLNFFQSKSAKSVKDVVAEVSKADPCALGNSELYAYKVKLLLCACALGMTPEKEWNGSEDANGGYIAVKRDGSVVCYHLYNRTEFYEYLYNYTYFEKGSSTRHKYMQIFESNGDYYVCLNLQIRFKSII